MTAAEFVNAGVAHQIGHYADAVRVPAGYDQIIVSGTPGVRPDGTVPNDITEEATQAWMNVQEILTGAGARLTDIVAVRQWLTNEDNIAAYLAVRLRFIQHEPAFMLGVVRALQLPEFNVEIEVIAARPAERD
jgi:2-iminobutanoate/2-iminopropanoate deaminase